MRRVTFSGKNKNIDDIANSYNLCKSALLLYKEKIIQENFIPDEYIGFTREELDIFFRGELQELEEMFILDMASAIEAKFRMDYLRRVSERKKDELSRVFRRIPKDRRRRPRLEDDILENWKEYTPHARQHIGVNKELLQYRNWLAHGSYWTARFPRNYDLSDVYLICKPLEEMIEI